MKRAFKGLWIPAEIWLDNSLTITEKVLYAEIDSFCGKGKECYASNEHFAELLQVSNRRVQQLLKEMEAKGLITRRMIYKEGTKEVLRRFLKPVPPIPFDTTPEIDPAPSEIDFPTPMKNISPPHEENFVTPHEESFATPHEENFVETNTDITNTFITNTEEIDIRNSEGVATVAPYQKIVEMYHATCTSLPKIRNSASLSESRKKAIKARWCEWNRSLDSFKECFEKVEASDFLSGRNGKWSNCGFDWIMKQSSFTKIMEGNYDNKAHGQNSQPSQIVDSDVDWSKYDG